MPVRVKKLSDLLLWRMRRAKLTCATWPWFISPNATFRKITEAGPHDFFDAPPSLFGAPQPPDLFLAEGVLNRGGGRLAEMAKVCLHEERHQSREIVVTGAHGFSSP